MSEAIDFKRYIWRIIRDMKMQDAFLLSHIIVFCWL